MHIQADNVSLLNDKLMFQGADHDWFQIGNIDNRFIQALDFTTSFLYHYFHVIVQQLIYLMKHMTKNY